MAITLKALGWIFSLVGIVAGIALYPKDPLTSDLAINSYILAKAAEPGQKVLAGQVAFSGIVAGVFTGAAGCALQLLEEILFKVTRIQASKPSTDTKEPNSTITL